MTLATESSGGGGRRHGLHRSTRREQRARAAEEDALPRRGHRGSKLTPSFAPGKLRARGRNLWFGGARRRKTRGFRGLRATSEWRSYVRRVREAALRQTGRQALTFGKSLVPFLIFSKNSRARPRPLAVAVGYPFVKGLRKMFQKTGKAVVLLDFFKDFARAPGPPGCGCKVGGFLDAVGFLNCCVSGFLKRLRECSL